MCIRDRNTSVDGLQRGGIFRAVAGRARLIPPAQLPGAWDPLLDDRTSVWEATLYLAKTLAEQGAPATATLMATVGPVSYTHLDVYKRQPSVGSIPT